MEKIVKHIKNEQPDKHYIVLEGVDDETVKKVMKAISLIVLCDAESEVFEDLLSNEKSPKAAEEKDKADVEKAIQADKTRKKNQETHIKVKEAYVKISDKQSQQALLKIEKCMSSNPTPEESTAAAIVLRDVLNKKGNLEGDKPKKVFLFIPIAAATLAFKKKGLKDGFDADAATAMIEKYTDEQCVKIASGFIKFVDKEALKFIS